MKFHALLLDESLSRGHVLRTSFLVDGMVGWSKLYTIYLGTIGKNPRVFYYSLLHTIIANDTDVVCMPRHKYIRLRSPPSPPPRTSLQRLIALRVVRIIYPPGCRAQPRQYWRRAMPPTYAGAAAGHHNNRGQQQNSNNNNNNYAQAQTAQTQMPLTPTAMSRWSVSSNQLPPVDQIKALHVYDFDNTRECSLRACSLFHLPRMR